MNWSDERYVKLYVRNTATWVLWPWQARALFPSLLRVANGAGIIETGPTGIDAVAMLTAMPREVVDVGMSAMIADGTVEPIRGGFLLPNFLEAQEATKTERLKKRDQRERIRDQRRAEVIEKLRVDVPSTGDISGHAETVGTEPEPSKTYPADFVQSPVPLQPSPAQPPAQPPAQKETCESPDVAVDALRDAWNALTSRPLPRWSTDVPTSKHRRKAALAALERRPLEQWREVFKLVEASAFCRGSTGWTADVDWAIRPSGAKPEPAAKLLEGSYSGGSATRPKSLAPARAEDSRAAFEAMANLTPEEREKAALEAFAS